MLHGTDMEGWNDVHVSTGGRDYSFPVPNFNTIHLLVSELNQTVTKMPEHTEIYDFSVCVYQSTEFKLWQKFFETFCSSFEVFMCGSDCVFLPELPMNSNTEFWWAWKVTKQFF